MFDLFQAVEAIRRDWHNLHDVDKGEKIAEIFANGKMSGRTLSQARRMRREAHPRPGADSAGIPAREGTGSRWQDEHAQAGAPGQISQQDDG
jgi:hypothetical protein